MDKIFGKPTEKQEEKTLPWIPLTSISQLTEIEKKSSDKVQVIFKHSTRCGISRSVINRFVDGYELTEDQVDLYYLDLLNYRDVSNETGYKFQVIHQSPQLLVIKNGEVMHHASHHEVAASNIEKFI